MNSKLRIGGAVIIGVLLIGGSFIVSPGTGAAVPDPRVEAVVAPAPPRNFIDVDDTDGDGIYDVIDQCAVEADLSGLRRFEPREYAQDRCFAATAGTE